jgi:hypothetical protein
VHAPNKTVAVAPGSNLIHLPQLRNKFFFLKKNIVKLVVIGDQNQKYVPTTY